MAIQPYLAFSDGNCEQALNFYRSVLGGEVTFMMRFGDSPMAKEIDPSWHGKIMHATYSLDGQQMMACDRPPHVPGPGGFCGFSLSVAYNDVASGEAVFIALGVGGLVTMPFAPTFWAKGFGMLIDRFGVSWMVNCE